MLYNTLIHPYLSYCNIIWGSAKVSSLNSLFLLQKRAVRMCTNSDFKASSGPLFNKLKILKIFDLNKYLTATFLFKFTNNLLPASGKILVELSDVTCNYSLRNAGMFRINAYKTSYTKNCISVRGLKLWNSLPTAISTLLSIGLLKKSLHSFFSAAYVAL